MNDHCLETVKSSSTDLLMPTLNGTITFIKMNDIASFVSQQLHFDVPWPLDEFLNEHRTVPESGCRLGRSSLEHFSNLFHVSHDSHS